MKRPESGKQSVFAVLLARSLRVRAHLAAFLVVLVTLTPLGVRSAEPTESSDFLSMSLDQLVTIKVDKVYAASKREESVGNAPSSVSIVSSQDIKEFGYRTLFDVLNSVRGLYATMDRNYEFLGVRGVNRPGDFGGRNLLLVDGHRMNEPLFDSVLLANGFILDPDLIDHVEIVRGPGSVLYGNNAFFSVINVVTKSGRQYNWAEGSFEAGSFDTYKGRFTLGRRFTNEVEFVLSGTYLESGGEPKYYDPSFDDGNPAHNHGYAENLDYERAKSAFTKLSYHDFTFEAGINERKKGVPTASFGTIFNDPRYSTTDTQGYLDLSFQHAIEDDWRVLGRVSYSEYMFGARYPLDYGGAGDPKDYVLNEDSAKAEWIGVEGQLSKTLFERHTLTAGAELREYLHESYRNFDSSPYQEYRHVDKNDYTAGAFVNGEFQLYKTNAILHAGVRYDTFSLYDSAVSPRAALVLHPFEPATLKFIYGEAYRAPNVYEAYGAAPGGKPNPELKPETIRTYELVWEQKVTDRVIFTLDGYVNEMRGLIVQDIDPIDNLAVSRNEDDVRGKGVEAECQVRFPSGWHGRASYSLQETSPSLSNSPHHLVKLNLVAPIYLDKLSAGVEARYFSDVQTVSARPVEGYWVVDATLFAQKFAKGLEASLSVYNLLDQRYVQTGGTDFYPEMVNQIGRSCRFKLTYHF